MLVDVTDAKYIDNYRLEGAFEDGKWGIVDLSEYRPKRGVFSQFKNIDFFRSFVVNKDLGTIVWSDTVDIASERLYEKCSF